MIFLINWLENKLILLEYYYIVDPGNNEQLFTEVEVVSGGYLPSREAAR